MPVPNTMADLATLAGSNSPQGTEAIGNSLDNYLRAGFAIIRSTNALASATIAAASTTDLASADAESVFVTGAATINSLGTGFNGCRREARFTGVCTLVNSGSIQLPNGLNVTTANGDIMTFRCVASGQWVCVGMTRPNILAITGLSAFAYTLLDDPDAATARATLGAQASLGYTPVNKAGDTMSGQLTISVPASSSLVIGTATVVGTMFSNDALSSVIVGSTSNHPLRVITNNSTRMLVTSTGNVTVGSSGSPGIGRFNVTDGNAYFAPASSTLALVLSYNQTRADAGQSAYIGASDSATPDLVFTNAGGTQIGRMTTGGVFQSTSIQPGGTNFAVTSFVVSNSAPGALAQGTVYFQY